VVIVTYCAEDFIASCLESLCASTYGNLRIVVVENDSPDATAETVRAWATGAQPFEPEHDWPFPDAPPVSKPLDFEEMTAAEAQGRRLGPVSLVHSGMNLGFAAGVNIGMRLLLADPGVKYIWILNPDTVVDPAAAAALVSKAEAMERFAVIGPRVVFLDRPNIIQTDAGRLRPLTHTGVGVNMFAEASTAHMPDPDSIDFIPGISMLASREFIDRAGPMEERWFVYIEEIEWQRRRGDLPFGLVPEARILHRAGAAINAGGESTRAAPFSVYFSSRNMLRFAWADAPLKAPATYLLAYYKLWRHWGPGWPQFVAMFLGLHQLPPPQNVRAKLPERVWQRVLGRKRGARR